MRNNIRPLPIEYHEIDRLDSNSLYDMRIGDYSSGIVHFRRRLSIDEVKANYDHNTKNFIALSI